MDPDSSLKEIEANMAQAVDYMLHEFSAVRTGKASPALVENLDVLVRSYGSTMKLKGLAVITTPEPRMIMIQPFDHTTIQDIERAIRESKLGLNPSNEGRSIRLPVPELSEERRREMVKLVKHLAEEARVRVRAVRKEGMDAAKKMKAENLLTEDTQRTFESDVQDLTNKYTKQIDEHVASKEAEVMKV